MRGRYRTRTWLRGNLPAAFYRFLPKGRKDCGKHEWYRSDQGSDRCYHCNVGERPHDEPLEGVAQGTEELMADAASANSLFARR